ncbi:hypothetical protein K1719_034762 [Acacia pycnantha]|nr:hypothetical protein K1719_034762 [Acacia pycnantha]
MAEAVVGEIMEMPNNDMNEPKVEDEVIIDIKEMIQDYGDDHGLLSSECCIYRVPTKLRHLKEEAYTPQVVSIGPFHHGNERLQDMERHKPILFKRFTYRAERAGSSLDDLVGFVKCLEPKVRASYSEAIGLTEQQLVKLILVDAGFIIELFISNWKFELRNDAKLSKEWLEDSIREDLILIENQLPFFVIEELFNKALPKNHDDRSGPSFLELVYHYFDYFNSRNLEPNDVEVKVKHFTDLLRSFYMDENMPRRDYYSTGEGRHILLYKANALQDAGIKLKAKTSKDVDLLVDKKIVFDYSDPMNKMKATLKQHYWNTLIQDYCSTPWRAVVSIAGIILLVLTIIQTIFSVLQVVWK